MADRKIAILLFDERRLPEVRNTVDILMANSACSDITVFSEKDFPEFNRAHENAKCENARFPECDKPDLETSKRNAILRKYESEGFDGILHVVSDGISLLKDPSVFMDDLESMMTRFDYPVWLATVTDPCNYVYGKYVPRLVLRNDMPELAGKGIRYGIAVTSHSNTAWMAYDLKALSGQKDIEYFCEEFTVPMFYIIEFLARRRERKTGKQLFFMNQYLTVDSEYGVFKLASDLPQLKPDLPETMQSEDAKFKAMNVRYQPDADTNRVIDAIIEAVMEKTASV